MTPQSSDEPLWNGDDHVVTLSPSTLQTLADCPLRWLRNAMAAPIDVMCAPRSAHCCTRWSPSRQAESANAHRTRKAWTNCPSNPAGIRQRAGPASRDDPGVPRVAGSDPPGADRGGHEVDVDGVLDGQSGTGVSVRLRGRVDRIERDGAGRPVIVDIKTGKTPVSKDDAQRHAQLAMYQLAVAEGLSPASGWGPRSAGECSLLKATSPAARGWYIWAGPGPAAPPNASRTR